MRIFLTAVILGLSVRAFALEEMKEVSAAVPVPSRYFVIQNIATEKTRVYERCTQTPDCPHRLVFEADNVVGKPEEGTAENRDAFKTLLGHSQISGWMKFYQDYKHHYPHWYKAGQDLATLPPPAPVDADGNGRASLLWGNKWKLKNSYGETTMYGAFGWYAAMLSPEEGIDYQWMHGTIGWAGDGEAAIHLTRSILLNIFANPGSSGCTRLSNASIAYLRYLLPIGTDVYRVYARESTRVPECSEYDPLGTCARENINSRYANQTERFSWDFIMVTDEAQKMNGVSADARTIENRHIAVVPGVNLLQRGTLTFDQYPNPVHPNYTWVASSGKSGDRYEIDDPTGMTASNFRGYFLVDEGRFIDYHHPDNAHMRNHVYVGGLEDFKTDVPAELRTSGTHYPPKIIYKEEPPQG